jgi:hypothetical protein
MSERDDSGSTGSAKMTIYAIFICMTAIGQCRMAEPGRQTFEGYVPETTYQTLDACEKKVKIYTPYPRKDMVFKCFGKHVDEWEPSN